jgi:hypothetical protein
MHALMDKAQRSALVNAPSNYQKFLGIGKTLHHA